MATARVTSSFVADNSEEARPPSRSYRRTRSQPPVPVKDRLITSWYRLRYGWSFTSSVQMGTSPVWLLGSCYYQDKDDVDIEGAPQHVLMFLEHFYSIPYITYRCGFPAILNSSYTTDCGWGCMIRSGQMMLATALHCHLLGKDWRLATSDAHGHVVHRQILSWFGDSPQELHPFSMHQLMDKAVRHGHQPGDWFGPSQVAVLLRECVRKALKDHINIQKLNMYVSHDCTVYVEDVLDIFRSDREQSILVLIPVRLGSESLNKIYIPCVKSLLTLENNVGIIGGRPKHSVYLVGFQDDHLLHLDPHYSQSAVNMSLPDFDISTYHCKTPKKLSVSKMDPSCTLAFYCHDQEEFLSFRTHAEKVLAPPMQKGEYPFFSFYDGRLSEIIDPEVSATEGMLHDVTSDNSTDDGFLILEYDNKYEDYPP